MAITKSNAAALLEQDVVREIFKNATKGSAVMSLGRRLGGATSDSMKLRVLDALPVAYWVDAANGGYKSVTQAAWENKYINFEELACIIPIKQSLLDDVDADIWGEIRPLIEEAFAKAVDNAVISGINKPAGFPASLLSQITTAGAIVTGTADLYEDINDAMSLVETSGYNVSGILGGVGMKALFRNMRDDNGQPINGTEIGALPRHYVENGAWDSTVSKLVVGDFSQLVYAIRDDVTYKVLTEAVIQDPTTKEIVYNLAQQDMVALRVYFRFGWALPNPVNSLNDTESRFPFAAVSASAGSISGQTVTFTVTDADAVELEGATINCGGVILHTDEDGEAVFTFGPGHYEYVAKYDGAHNIYGAVDVASSSVTATVEFPISTTEPDPDEDDEEDAGGGLGS